jgi:hypothetical protein
VRSISLDDRLAELADADRDVAPPLDLETRTLVAWETWWRDHEGSLPDRSDVSSRVPIRVIAALTGLAAAVLLGLAIPRATLHPDRGEVHDALPHETAIVPRGPVEPFHAGRPIEPPGETSRVENRADPVSSASHAGGATRISPGGPVSNGEPINNVAGDWPVRNVGRDPDRRRVTREPVVHRRGVQPPEPLTDPGSAVAPPSVETASFVPLGPDVERELTGAFQLARIGRGAVDRPASWWRAGAGRRGVRRGRVRESDPARAGVNDLREDPMNKIGVALLLLPLMGAHGARAQTPEARPRVERQVNFMVVHGPGDSGAPPLTTPPGADGDFMSMPLGVGGEPVAGAPYSAEAVTETVQTLADGNRIVRQSTASVYRDTSGRTRREQGLVVLGNIVAGADRRTQVQIHDPQSGSMYLLDLENRTAHRLPSPKIVLAQRLDSPAAPPPPGTAGVWQQPGTPGVAVSVPFTARTVEPPPTPAAGVATFDSGSLTTVQTGVAAASFNIQLPAPAGDPQNAVFFRRGLLTALNAPQIEQLGKQFIEGVEAEGTRSTSVIPAGQIGNEQPITIVSERWFAPELKALMMSRQTDPRFGETTYRLTNVLRSEPAADLFEVPPDFRVIDGPGESGTWLRMKQ